jgi:hypothetical protein
LIDQPIWDRSPIDHVWGGRVFTYGWGLSNND